MFLCRHLARLMFAIAFGTLTSPACDAMAQAQPTTTEADRRLHALYTTEWKGRQRELARVGADGTRGSADHCPRVDAGSQQAPLAYWNKALATLDSIPYAQLSSEEQINAQVFRASIDALVTDVRFRTYEAPFNADTFFWTEFTPRQSFPKADEYLRYLARLRDVPRYFDEQIVNMRAGLARGYNVDPSSTLPVADALIRARKDFELLVVPNGRHGATGPDGARRRNDFFVRTLLGVMPPDWNGGASLDLPMAGTRGNGGGPESDAEAPPYGFFGGAPDLRPPSWWW